MKKSITFIVFTFLLSLHTNAQWWNSGEKVKGNGNVTTESRNTSDYDAIAVGGSFDVLLTQGEEGNITIEGEENLLEHIQIEVNKGTLKIKVKKNVNLKMTKKLVVTVPHKDIAKISLGGSGTISNKGTLTGNSLTVSLGGSGTIDLNVETDVITSNIGGSGNIKFSGKTEEMNCKIAGSGSIKAYDLQTESLDAVIAGSGDVRSSVKNSISANVVGSGSIFYKGNPDKINTTSLGSGSVVKKD